MPGKLRRRLEKGRISIVEEGTVRRSSQARRVFTLAERLAAATDQQVYPIHILSALLTSADHPRDAVLASSGVSIEELRDSVNFEILAPREIANGNEQSRN